MNTPIIQDEAGPGRQLAHVSWRDSETESWHYTSEYALSTAGALRSVLSNAASTGKLKHKFYRLDSGKPLHQEAIPGRANREDTAMSKLAKSVSEGVQKINKLTKEDRELLHAQARAAKEKARAEAKAAKAEKKANKKASKKDAKPKPAAKPKKSKEASQGATPGASVPTADVPATPTASTLPKGRKVQWYGGMEGVLKLTSGPHPTRRMALAAIGNGNDFSDVIEAGKCYTRKEKIDDEHMNVFIVMKPEYAEANHYELP